MISCAMICLFFSSDSNTLAFLLIMVTLLVSEPNEILKQIEVHFKNTKNNNKLKALVTAGPTREFIDPVRFISNRSSGKQGYEIAKSFRDNGFETTLISGQTDSVSYTHLTLPPINNV